MYLFAYGTLKPKVDSYPVKTWLGDVLAEVEVRNAEMYDLGPYPAAFFNLEGKDSSIKGVIIELTEGKEGELIGELDFYESAPSLYKRTAIKVPGYGTAITYEYALESIEELGEERKVTSWPSTN